MDELEVIKGHYLSASEGQRLEDGVGRLEFLRTQEILRRHLGPAPARILDIGGATGVHAEWLAHDGYEVHIVDLVEHHVEQARDKLARSGVRATVGDARNLAVKDREYDAVLLLGPLYHLTLRDDRLLALAEARRVAKPGGLVCVAAINRFASLFDGLARGFLFEPGFKDIVEQDIATGQHRNPGDHPHWFTTAFFHHPAELRDEIHGAGLKLIDLVGLEGLAGWLSDLPSDTEEVLYAARAVESEESLLGLSAHILAVARS
ncbi:MAG: methyltransferase domain-containing protein [Acidimicrobiales bacterium]